MSEIDMICTDLLIVLLTIFCGVGIICGIIWAFVWFINRIADEVLDIVKKVKDYEQD